MGASAPAGRCGSERESPTAAAPHGKLLLAVEPIHTLVVAAPAGTLQQDVQATISEAWPALSNLAQRSPQPAVVATAYVAAARARHTECRACPAEADGKVSAQDAYSQPASGRRHHFFAATCLSIWLSSVKLAAGTGPAELRGNWKIDELPNANEADE